MPMPGNNGLSSMFGGNSLIPLGTNTEQFGPWGPGTYRPRNRPQAPASNMMGPWGGGQASGGFDSLPQPTFGYNPTRPKPAPAGDIGAPYQIGGYDSMGGGDGMAGGGVGNSSYGFGPALLGAMQGANDSLGGSAGGFGDGASSPEWSQWNAMPASTRGFMREPERGPGLMGMYR